MNAVLSGDKITFRNGKFIPYLVLAVLLSLSVLIWRHYENMSMEKEQRRYEEYVNATVKEITERLDKYSMILRGGAGVFSASEEVTREEWGAYYEHQQVGTLYPGVQGLGFSRGGRPAPGTGATHSGDQGRRILRLCGPPGR